MGEVKFVKEKGLVERKIGNEYTEYKEEPCEILEPGG